MRIKPNTTKPEQWITRHKQEEKAQKDKMKGPDVGTYKNNFPVEYESFGKMLEKSKEKGDKKLNSKYLGVEERFKDPKKSKSLMQVAVPGAGQYPLIAHWPGKLTSLSLFWFIIIYVCNKVKVIS